ncbi:MAG: endolytic transglycosylase MltG [Myxococcales bacterium]|nr:endolytic transglycosylase MltG [Myxococcales bacterium]
MTDKPPPKRRLLRRSRRGQRWALVVVLATLATGAYFIHRGYEAVLAYPSQPLGGAAEQAALEVPRGASFPDVLALLVEHEVVPQERALYFKLYVLHRGAAGKITAGEHTLGGAMTPDEALAELMRKQPAREVSVTIPEGKHSLEIAARLAKAGLASEEALIAAMRDAALLEELGVPAKSAEGYLFPDTYKFKSETSAEDIVRRLVTRHHQVYADLKRRHREELAQLERQLGWQDHQVVTLASIVEKETGAAVERPLIAGVFLNRMRFPSFQPKRLETDPTIIYGCTVAEERSKACESFAGRIRKIHLTDPDNPYNTYTHEGLPPGPITNPGRAALEGVMAPKRSRFLFFVARGDGTHQFSKSRAEHEAAVDRYIRGKGGAGDAKAEDAKADGG